MLHWWPEERLLLAGCVDEKVIAFDDQAALLGVRLRDGPGRLEAAKQLVQVGAWARGNPRPTPASSSTARASALSAARTLEILNGEGKLVKRLPVFWGTGAVFQIARAGRQPQPADPAQPHRRRAPGYRQQCR